ncbi:hypothetical protein [Brachyspira aalborgi]|jgi:hypothetical protein|uniref:Lipoprotein n=1 Tax=Brachyspira aalborgi TaxID=29522 RepID=A0ABY3K6N2_9SPIR|nr:hypothetical protein [Brachyspira aalborgi]TXJ31156.1 hypothetical protein EPJ71_10505 [Brachyspira aalborgi]TXJ40046.1 hypothetical protein EPJ65_12445 [Brachyspira aalborgi]DAZ18869.1 MAG TPA: hypothetical protein [Caudoviricetes sp.]
MRKSLILFSMLFILGCAAKVKYITVPLTKPPARYEIYTITNTQQALLEYRKATMRLARWQNWYNRQVGSNYFNYKNYTNIIPQYFESDTNYIIFTNMSTNIITNELITTNTNEIRNK